VLAIQVTRTVAARGLLRRLSFTISNETRRSLFSESAFTTSHMNEHVRAAAIGGDKTEAAIVR
jgi:hypothetical protein